MCFFYISILLFDYYLMSSLASKLKKGTKVKITAKNQFLGQVGTVRFVGPLEDKKSDGDYVGLQLEKPIGKNNGTYNGKQYFKVKPNFGMFLKPTSLSLMDGSPVVPASTNPKPAQSSNKLSKDLEDLDRNEETKEEAAEKSELAAKAEKEELQLSEAKQENEELKKKVKDFEDQIKNLKAQNEKYKYAPKDRDENKQNELKQQIQFYKNQKQAIEKQKLDLKKKNAQLNAELEEYAENIGMVDTLTIKIQNLQAKNQKLKQQLESTKSQLKNYKMTEQSSGKNEEQLSENLRILNQTVVLLQNDLKETSERVIQLEEELKKKEVNEGDLKKLQRKLKQKQEQIQQMSNELELMSDTAGFVEKLTMNMLKKEEDLKETRVKLSEYMTKCESMETQLALNKEFTEQMNQQLFQQQQLMDRYCKEIEEKNRNILQQNRQIQKYKKKIIQLTQSNQAIMSFSLLSQDKDQLLSKPIYTDQYQNKFYHTLKINNQIKKNQLKHLIQFSDVRNHIGVYILNLTEALPQSFTSKLYPEVITILTSLKSANDKLYYIFTTVADTFKNKQDIYAKQNHELAQWLIILMKQVITLYGCLHKIEYSFTTAQTQQEISEILDHRILRDQIRKVNHFALQILQRFVDDNISSSINLDPFINSVESFDQIIMNLKKTFTVEYQTKMRLCVQAMDTVSDILEAIFKYKQTHQLGENAEVDNSLQLFLKAVYGYIKQCCMNPYIRFKSQMKQYLQGLNLISNILNDIGVQGNYHELQSLYSDTQNIRLLRETILATQYHANVLQNDLKDIIYTSEVSKIQTQLPGKFWQDRIKLIKEQLLQVKIVEEQKNELEKLLIESKKKILLLQRDLKDKQSIKQLYEKRIGQLQLKVEQVTSIQNQNKRQSQKIRSYQEANKTIEQEIISLTKKNKSIQEENKKIKEKFDTLQTETMMRNKKQKVASNMSTEDIANLTIFKNALKQTNQLKTFDLKKKLLNLKQSPIYNMKQAKKDSKSSLSNVRLNAFEQISKFTITDPFNSKKNPTEANLDSILLQISRVKGNLQLNKQPSSQVKNMKVGFISVNSKEARLGKINTTSLSIFVN